MGYLPSDARVGVTIDCNTGHCDIVVGGAEVRSKREAPVAVVHVHLGKVEEAVGGR